MCVFSNLLKKTSNSWVIALVVVYQEVVLLIFENESKVFIGYTKLVGVVMTGFIGLEGITAGTSVLPQANTNRIPKAKNIFFID